MLHFGLRAARGSELPKPESRSPTALYDATGARGFGPDDDSLRRMML